MSEDTRNQLVTQEEALDTPRGLRSLLVPIDLSADSDRVVERAALLPLTEGAVLTLLHVMPRRLPRDAISRVEDDAREALELQAVRLRQSLPEGIVVRQVVTVGAPAAEIVEHAASVQAEAIVMGRGGGRALRDAFLGSTAERVIRQGGLPVLVVRLPAAPYQRPALAVDLDQAARDVITWMLRVIPPPRPEVALIHAYDAPFQGFVYPSLSREEIDEYREHLRQKALHEITHLVGSTLAAAGVPPEEAPSFKTHVRYGSPRTFIEKTVEKTGVDLLVLGTRGHSGLAQAFLGTVAGDVLREVPCDVLVVPPRRDTSETP